MKSLKSFAMILGMCLAFTSCDKSDDNNDEPIGTPSEVLTAKQWKLVEASATIAGSEVDLLTADFKIIPDCMLDDLITFEDGGTISTDDNVDICTEEESSIIELKGNWRLNDDETIMTIDNGELELSGDVQLDSNDKVSFAFEVEITGVSAPGTLTLEANK
jgi:hypothetical protein